MSSNEYASGKYKLGGDWVKKMPRTRAWFQLAFGRRRLGCDRRLCTPPAFAGRFNSRLESLIFPTIAALFPEIVSSASVLRAHSVAILKYNSSHPRTDVHVDDGSSEFSRDEPT